MIASVSRLLPILTVTGRDEKLRTELDRISKAKSMLVLSPDSIRWLIGFTGSAGSLVVRPHDMVFVTDGRYVEQATMQAEQSGAQVEVRLAVSGGGHQAMLGELVGSTGPCAFDPAEVSVQNFETYQTTFAGSLVQAPGVVTKLRRIKTDAEIARIEAAAHATDLALNEVEPLLYSGATERDIRDELDYKMRRHGGDGPSYDTIVATGPNGARPHHRPTDTQIVDGHSVVIDVGALVDGYHSDMTRTYLIGEVDPVMRDMHRVVSQAQLLGIAKVAPGVLCSEVDQVCREYIAGHGYGSEFVHSTGHGVGLQIHELPWLRKDFSEPLQAGEVVTVEPGVYRGGLGGVRIEDLLVVTPASSRILTKSQKDQLCLPSPRTT